MALIPNDSTIPAIGNRNGTKPLTHLSASSRNLPILFGRVHVVGAAFAVLFVEGILMVLEFDRAPVGGKLVGVLLQEARLAPMRASSRKQTSHR